jgi:glycosyltransferase involved in cell wall biosynthesis
MKILFVASLYNPHVGGIETVIKELSRRYQDRGIDICVLTKRYPHDLEEHSCIDGVDVYRVNSAKTLEDFEEVSATIRTIEIGLRADIVHIIGLRRPLGIFALALARKWKVPLIVSAAGGELPEPGDETSQLIWKEGGEIANEVVLQADRNVTFSEDLRKLIHKHVSNNIDVDIVHAGVDLDAIGLVAPRIYEAPFIFLCRRLVWSKGVDISVGAFSRVAMDFPKIHLVIAGEGDEYEALVRLVDHYGLTDRVKFLGTVLWEESIGWLKSAEFTVVPSRAEGGGLINIEAQACGCPVIGSRAAGIAEYTRENETALLFDVGDVDACASHMRTLLSDKGASQSLGVMGMVYSKEFSWDNIVDEYLLIYKECVESLKRVKRDFRSWSDESETVWDIISKP